MPSNRLREGEVRMSRQLSRSPLAFAFAAVMAAACAQGSAAPRPTPVPAHDVPVPGTVHEDVFFSQALGVRKHAVVYLPASYGRDSTRRYPVVYYLHGLSGA